MAKTTTTRYDVTEHLRTPEEMAAYLEACLEEADGDAAFVAKAPPAVPVVPPVDVAPVLRPLPPQDQTQRATPSTETRDPMIFFNMQFLTQPPLPIKAKQSEQLPHGSRRGDSLTRAPWRAR